MQGSFPVAGERFPCRLSFMLLILLSQHWKSCTLILVFIFYVQFLVFGRIHSLVLCLAPVEYIFVNNIVLLIYLQTILKVTAMILERPSGNLIIWFLIMVFTCVHFLTLFGAVLFDMFYWGGGHVSLIASRSDALIFAPHSDPTIPLIAQKHLCPIYYVV